MKVLVVDNGLGPFVDEQVESIKKLDKSVEIVRYSFSGVKNKLNYIKAIFHINKMVKEKNIDIIHAHYGLTGFIALFQNKCPIICTFHGSDVLYVKWQGIISRFTARHCVVNIAVSKKIAQILNTKNTYIIPCGVNQDFFKPEDKIKVRERLNLDINKKYILFPSDPKRKVKNYALFKKVYEELRKKYDIGQLILKGLSRKGVRDYLNATDLVLLTSFSESTNTTIKEALFCNTPVVSVDVGDHKDILLPFSEYLISNYSPSNIIEQVSYVLDHSDYFENINFRKKVSRYKLKHIAERIIKIYNNVYYLYS